MTKKINSPKDRWTISTFVFDTKEEAEKKLLEFDSRDDLYPKTKLMKVSEVYSVKVEKSIVYGNQKAR